MMQDAVGRGHVLSLVVFLHLSCRLKLIDLLDTGGMHSVTSLCYLAFWAGVLYICEMN